jgi:hypothetical protein
MVAARNLIVLAMACLVAFAMGQATKLPIEIEVPSARSIADAVGSDVERIVDETITVETERLSAWDLELRSSWVELQRREVEADRREEELRSWALALEAREIAASRSP